MWVLAKLTIKEVKKQNREFRVDPPIYEQLIFENVIVMAIQYKKLTIKERKKR